MAAINVFGAPCWLCLCHRVLSRRSPSNWISPRTARSKGQKNKNNIDTTKFRRKTFRGCFPVSCFGPCGTQPQHLAPCRNRSPLRHPEVAPQPWHPQIAPNHGTHTQAWHPAATSRGRFSHRKNKAKVGFCCNGLCVALATRLHLLSNRGITYNAASHFPHNVSRKTGR